MPVTVSPPATGGGADGIQEGAATGVGRSRTATESGVAVAAMAVGTGVETTGALTGSDGSAVRVGVVTRNGVTATAGVAPSGGTEEATGPQASTMRATSS